MWKSPEDRRASWRAGRPRMAFSLHTEVMADVFKAGAAWQPRSVGSTPAPLRLRETGGTRHTPSRPTVLRKSNSHS